MAAGAGFAYSCSFQPDIRFSRNYTRDKTLAYDCLRYWAETGNSKYVSG